MQVKEVEKDDVLKVIISEQPKRLARERGSYAVALVLESTLGSIYCSLEP